jgi:hypothetical protein
VMQIVQAHGWDIHYFESAGWGGGFRLSGLQAIEGDVW